MLLLVLKTTCCTQCFRTHRLASSCGSHCYDRELGDVESDRFHCLGESASRCTLKSTNSSTWRRSTRIPAAMGNSSTGGSSQHNRSIGTAHVNVQTLRSWSVNGHYQQLLRARLGHTSPNAVSGRSPVYRRRRGGPRQAFRCTAFIGVIADRHAHAIIVPPDRSDPAARDRSRPTYPAPLGAACSPLS
jgi:hypothetical protein